MHYPGFNRGKALFTVEEVLAIINGDGGFEGEMPAELKRICKKDPEAVIAVCINRTKESIKQTFRSAARKKAGRLLFG